MALPLANHVRRALDMPEGAGSIGLLPNELQAREPLKMRKLIDFASRLVAFRVVSGDGVTGDGGYGDVTGDKIFTGDLTG